MKKLISFLLLAVYIPLTVFASVTVTVNGTNHTIPQTNERGWGNNVTGWIQDISADVLYPTGGNFTLGADVDWGGSFGHKSAYYKSRSSSPSDAGVLRLGNAQSLGWRNNADSGNLLLTVNSSDQLTYNGIILSGSDGVSVDDSTFTIFDDGDSTKEIAFQASGITTGTTRTITMPDANVDLGGLTNSNIDGSAAIAYSKLNLTGSVLNADINSSAAIDATKIHDGSISNTEFGYLNGVTSAIQDQIDNINPSTISQTGNVDLNFVDEDTTDNDNGVVLRTNCTDTGSGTEDCDFSIRQQIAGTETAVITSNADGGITLGLPVYAANGSITTPGLGFLEGSAIGFWRAGNTISMGVNGVQVYVASTGELQLNQVARLQDAAQSSTVPGLVGASADDNTGVSLPGSDNLHLISGGVELARGSGGTTFDFKVQPTYNGLPIGGSSGGGLQLFSDAEADTHSNLVAYDDTNEAPTDLTGTDTSTSGLTISAESTEELGLSAESYQMDWSASDNQGVGAAITADPSQMPRIATTGPTPVTIKFDYESSGLVYNDGVEVWVYRVGSNIIESCHTFYNGSSTNHLLEATNGGTYKCQINLSSSDTGLRIGFHRDQTTATAINLVVDNIQVTAGSATSVGRNETDWETFTSVWNNLGGFTSSDNFARMRRNGPNLDIDLNVSIDGAGSGGTDASMDIPWPGNITPTASTAKVCEVNVFDYNNSNIREETTGFISGGKIKILAPNANGTMDADVMTVDVVLRMFCSIPIDEWKSGNQFSPYEISRLGMNSIATLSGDQTVSTILSTTIEFDQISASDQDFGFFDPANNRYVVGVTGRYRVVASAGMRSLTAGDIATFQIETSNGNCTERRSEGVTTSPVFRCEKYFDLEAGGTISATIDTLADASYIVTSASAETYLMVELVETLKAVGTNGVTGFDNFTSSSETIGGAETDQWFSMTGNEYTTDGPGTFVANGSCFYDSNGDAADDVRLKWSSEDGDNTTTTPAALTSASEITDAYQYRTNMSMNYLTGAGFDWDSDRDFPADTVIFKCNSACTIFLVTRVTTTSPGGSATITCGGNINRIQ